MVIVAIYAPPSWPWSRFEIFMDEVRDAVIRHCPRRALVLGDFNAKSTTWGSPRTDARGRVIAEWAAGLDMRLLNSGCISTCVRWRGESIDLSWASPPAARRVVGWRVMEDIETLSDHRYIFMRVLPSGVRGEEEEGRRVQSRAQPKRGWALKKMDTDMLRAVATAESWTRTPEEPARDVDWEAKRFQQTMKAICNAAMPRVRPSGRSAVHWWTPQIAEMRAACWRKRRQYMRARRKRVRDEAREEELYAIYREASHLLKRAIKESKTRSWDSFLDTLNRDPWGRPYRLVLGKIRLTESLSPEDLERILTALFPGSGEGCARAVPVEGVQETGCEAEEEEMAEAIKKMEGRSAAPGPDGVPGRALALALRELAPRLRWIYDGCLRSGRFPGRWKNARLVPIPKPDRDPGTPASYRPICVLDEVGRLFEKVLANRISSHLSQVGPGLSDNQYGFRVGHD